MLNLLYKFGLKLEQSDDLDKILIDPPKEEKDVKYYNVGILIDLDENKVVLDPQYLSEYDGANSIKKFLAVRTLGGNNKEFYLTINGNSYKRLIDTLHNSNDTCELKERILDKGQKFKETTIFKFSELIEHNFNNFTYENYYSQVTLKGNILTFDKNVFISGIKPLIGLPPKSSIMLYYILIKCTELNILQPTLAASIEGYLDFAKSQHLPQSSNKKDFCYVSGCEEHDILEGGNFPKGNLTKIFVTTTFNYTSYFQKENFGINYSLSKKSKEIVEFASNFLMKNLKINIAGTPHILIPEFPYGFDKDIRYAVEEFKKVNDIAFNSKEFEYAVTYFKEANELEENIFWFNYFGFESDQSSFKLVNRIKEVNSAKLLNISKLFIDNSIKILGKAPKYTYNFRTIYNIIPIKSPDTSKNPALDLIDAILENKIIDIQNIFAHFKELALYYYLDRKKVKGCYTNVYPYSDPKYFDFFIKDAINNYLVFIKTLLDLNQLTNHNFMEGKMEEQPTKAFYAKEEELFAQHGYTDLQKAMFYLGRMVSVIGYAQFTKGHKQKPILQKINFNGMGLREIVKLRSELYEKARQYKEDLSFLDGKFAKLFNYNNWNLPANEALFFLLNGYSFYVSSKDNDQNGTIQLTNNTEE